MTIQAKPKDAFSSSESPHAEENRTNSAPYYARMRALPHVIWQEELGVWAVFRDALCREVLADWEKFGSSGGAGFANFYREKPWREPSVVFEVDPPDHTRTRRVIGRVLSPRAVKEIEGAAMAEAKSRVAAALAKRDFDMISDLTKPFALKIVPDALGLAEDDRENMLIYRKYLVKGRGLHRHDPWTHEELAEAAWVSEWVRETCSRERVASGGLGSQIYEAVDAGEISEHEGNMLIRSFLSAGTDTTFTTIANTVLYLLQNPEQWARLQADPGKARNAFEEGLRYGSTSVAISRTVMREIEFHGAKLGQYDKILAYVASANRDPERWENSDKFDIERNVTGHLGLGTGIHGCVGQMIARMEATAILKELALQAKELSFGDEPYTMLTSGNGVAKLPVKAVPF